MRLLACLTFAVAPAFAQGVPEGQAVAYGCDGGATLAVAYINPPGGDSYAVVAYDGRLVPMKAGPTGSGVRYLSLDGSRLVWHAKGTQGFLARDADMSMIAEGCAETGG
jgi:membrane-bound inhibitor of C-type lysozyme